MEDWLVTFGTFQENLPAGTGAANHYLPVNNKSLVVSIFPIFLSSFSFQQSPSDSECFYFYFLLDDQVSILAAGTFFGALFAFPMGDMVGRKWGIVASCMIFCLGVGLQLDTHWATFAVGRVIAGIWCGMLYYDIAVFLTTTYVFLGTHLMFSPHVSIRGKLYITYYNAVTSSLLLSVI